MVVPQQVVLDLAGVTTGDELLDAVGVAFGFGGPETGGDATPAGAAADWGRNWEALADNLCFLDSGGVWGTGRHCDFPLQLVITGSEAFRARNGKDLAALLAILEEARSLYAQSGLVFRYSCS